MTLVAKQRLKLWNLKNKKNKKIKNEKIKK